MAVWEERCKTIERLLSPADLMALGLLLSPEGQPRRPDVVAFEERVLGYTDKYGKWS